MGKAILKSLFSVLGIVIWWVAIYSVLVYFGMRFAPESYIIQIFLATIFFLSSMVSVPFNEERTLVLRLSNLEIRTLEAGTYFYPFLGFWGKIFIPTKYREDTKVVHIDTRLMRTHEIKNWKEDLLVTIMTTFFPMAKKFSLWNIMFCLILGSLVGYGAVKIKKEYFPNTKQTKTEVFRNRVKKALNETTNAITKDIYGTSGVSDNVGNSNNQYSNSTPTSTQSQTQTQTQTQSQSQSQSQPEIVREAPREEVQPSIQNEPGKTREFTASDGSTVTITIKDKKPKKK
ncbi:hypothetical protein SDC9_07837 [bioreactor metagenome]|uniref:Uncharacterized protein n=1 Tax=bioreactor metagenome TaxID=1076179 RepID=A0A644T5M2_9ZZZZ|nr:hypothetical protein [Candidatus Elulimicrobiales bacterium]